MATLEIYRGNTWQPAATLTPVEAARGISGACRFEYHLDYAVSSAGPGTAAAAGLSCRFPVDFQLQNLPRWPAFVLDMLPSGYGRQQWLEQLKLQDGPSADWELLLNGTAFPPGNLRVAEARAARDFNSLVPTATGDVVPMKMHPGFSRAELLARGEAFVEYAFQHGIYAAGASDVQGVAPKLLLAQDHQGNWHAEGRLADNEVRSHWLVKRPRGNRAADRKVLRNEAAYMQVARRLGLRVHANLEWENDNLFVPRFDREVHNGKVLRYGMESLYSAAGIAEYGARVWHEVLCAALLQYCTDPSQELAEYVKRDVVNVVMGNKDNHGRNIALLRHEDGRTRLAPLFDFAPMYLDPEGIARVCRWSNGREEAGEPDWAAVTEGFPQHRELLQADLRDFAGDLQRLPDIMHECGIDDDIVERCAPLAVRHTQQLQAL